MASYSSVTWTTGDILTETKLDNMVANDQSEDAHAANGMIMNNNVAYKLKETGGTLKDGLKLNASNQLEFGGQICDWQAFTSTLTGFSGTPTQDCRYVRVRNIVFIYLHITGTSNTTAFTFTIPVTPAKSGHFPIARGRDNNTNGQRMVSTTASSSTADAFSSVTGGIWTGSGTKSIEQLYFTYEAE